VPEHQEQKVTVADFVSAASRGIDQLLNLAPGQMQPLALGHADIIAPGGPDADRQSAPASVPLFSFFLPPDAAKI
jgi:hypothetical protein